MPFLPPPTLILRHIAELVTLAAPDEVEGASGLLGLVHDAAIIARGETILFAGPDAQLGTVAFEASDGPPPSVLDLTGQLVTPGLIDPHTHVVFGGDRADEFQQRHAGVSYEAIQAQGGGIASTMRATRAASDAELFAQARARLTTMRDHGSTTVEIKTGYGLDRGTEDRLLTTIARLARDPTLPGIVPTFLGAHIVPPEWRERRAEYVALVRDDWLPAFAGRARFCDVFCERNAFDPAETRSILTAARRLGYGLKLHADQLSDSDGGEIAADLGATSADHLDYATGETLDRLAASGVVAVLLPGCSLTLDTPYPNARRFFEGGMRVALATDCNPGTSYCESLQLTATLAVAHMGMTIDEALAGITREAAAALGLTDRGIIAPGYRCDLAIWNVASHSAIAYRTGTNLAEGVVIGGVPIEYSCFSKKRKLDG
jgi:imidazolonepropionase